VPATNSTRNLVSPDASLGSADKPALSLSKDSFAQSNRHAGYSRLSPPNENSCSVFVTRSRNIWTRPNGPVGTTITIKGTGFGPTPQTIMIGNVPLTIVSWTDDTIEATVPANAITGYIWFQSGQQIISGDRRVAHSSPLLA